MTEKRDPTTLPEDIYSILEDETDHVVSEDNVQWAGKVFMQLLRTRLAKREEKRGEDVLRFSSLGKKDRQIWYAANMPEKAEKLAGKVKLKFLWGDLAEVLLLFLAKESRHEVTDEQIEVEEDGVIGHIDAKIDGVLVDVKTASPYSYEKFKSGEYVFNDPFGYIKQISGYAHKTNSERAAFLVANKVDGGLCYAEVDRRYLDGNPPKPRIDKLRQVIASEVPPERCYSDVPEGKSGNRKLDIGCSYCSFRDECWKDSNNGKGLRKFYYSRGPVWLSVVKKEPKVDEAE